MKKLEDTSILEQHIAILYQRESTEILPVPYQGNFSVN